MFSPFAFQFPPVRHCTAMTTPYASELFLSLRGVAGIAPPAQAAGYVSRITVLQRLSNPPREECVLRLVRALERVMAQEAAHKRTSRGVHKRRRVTFNPRHEIRFF